MKIVFSEKNPLFSESDLDNRILLLLMHKKAERDLKLKDQMKNMFREMVEYICKVDFDDITFKNLPLAEDGRLAPLDTDSGSSDTGVLSFLDDYYGTKVFDTYQEIKPIVNKFCTKQPN